MDADAIRDEGVTGVGWWTLAEMEASRSRFAPSGFPALLADLVREGVPAVPVDVGA